MQHPINLIEPARDWRRALRESVNDAGKLLRLLGLRAEQVGYSARSADAFPLKVPLGFVQRMAVGDPSDPLLRQVLADEQELIPHPGFNEDPVGECASATRDGGVIHKYRGRALLIATGACAVHCRYCFRRHFPYSDHTATRSQWMRAMDYLRRDASITEVILSGGDPLMASDELLGDLVTSLADIPHIKRLRVHSRLPIVIPERITDGLLEAMTRTRLQCVMVVHSNHGNEIDQAVAGAIHRLRNRNILTLNQAVLLAGINDDLSAQVALSEQLFEAGILPYYLHLLDPVAGAAHFDVPLARAKALYSDMIAHLPGYLVPKLVKEIDGAPAKVAKG